MATGSKTFTLSVKDGGHLDDTDLPQNVGAQNYVQKVNWRRLNDAEVRREGPVLFWPNRSLPISAVSTAQCFNANPIVPPAIGNPPPGFDDRVVIGVWEAVRGDGMRVLVAVTRAGGVYRFTYETGSWLLIGGPFPGATEWEAVSIDGYLILNNKIDLLMWVRPGDDSVHFLTELRKVGVATVGTISVYNGFLVAADITEFKRPVNAGEPDTFIAWMNGSFPYGRPPSAIVQRIRYKIIWSDYGKPLNWSPFIEGTIAAETRGKVTLDWGMDGSASELGVWGVKSPVFPAGTKIGVDGAGPNGGMLGGQVGTDDGVVVASTSGNEITFQEGVLSDASLTYPLRVKVSRFVDLSTFAGSSSIKDDSSPVIAIKTLKRGLIVYRETGIFSGRYTGIVETPFVFQPEYRGRNVPALASAIAEVNGDYHAYPTEDRFYFFDGTGEPRVHPLLDRARKRFFSFPNGQTITSPGVRTKVFAVQNPITREIWFCAPHTVLAFDYVTRTQQAIDGTCSYINRQWLAGCFCQPKQGGDNWFVLADPWGQLHQYGAIESGPFIFEPDAVLDFGWAGKDTDGNDKVMLSFTPIFSATQEVGVEVLFYAQDHIATATSLVGGDPFQCQVRLDKPITLPTIYTSHRAVYFYEQMRLFPSTDTINQLRFSGRTYEFLSLRTKGISKHDLLNGHIYDA